MKVWYDDALKEWYHANGNDSVRKIGLEDEEGWFSFSSENKAEVLKFMEGLNAYRNVLKPLFKEGDYLPDAPKLATRPVFHDSPAN